MSWKRLLFNKQFVPGSSGVWAGLFLTSRQTFLISLACEPSFWDILTDYRVISKSYHRCHGCPRGGTGHGAGIWRQRLTEFDGRRNCEEDRPARAGHLRREQTIGIFLHKIRGQRTVRRQRKAE